MGETATPPLFLKNCTMRVIDGVAANCVFVTIMKRTRSHMINNDSPCRTYIVYQHDLFAEGVRSPLEEQPTVQIPGMENNVDKALKAMRSLKPEVIIVEEHTAMPVLPKAIQELFALDFGRMNARLGVELPFTSFLIQTTIPYGTAPCGNQGRGERNARNAAVARPQSLPYIRIR
jgi:hypothetical protein